LRQSGRSPSGRSRPELGFLQRQRVERPVHPLQGRPHRLHPVVADGIQQHVRHRPAQLVRRNGHHPATFRQCGNHDAAVHRIGAPRHIAQRLQPLDLVRNRRLRQRHRAHHIARRHLAPLQQRNQHPRGHQIHPPALEARIADALHLRVDAVHQKRNPVLQRRKRSPARRAAHLACPSNSAVRGGMAPAPADSAPAPALAMPQHLHWKGICIGNASARADHHGIVRRINPR